MLLRILRIGLKGHRTGGIFKLAQTPSFAVMMNQNNQFFFLVFGDVQMVSKLIFRHLLFQLRFVISVGRKVVLTLHSFLSNGSQFQVSSGSCET